MRKQGVICRVWNPRDSPEIRYEQIVLPKQYHSKVLALAHDIPLSGHLGKEKTAQRVLRRFYWPTLFKDVKEYRQTCEECQLHGGRGAKATMIPLPVIGEPFKRIASDLDNNVHAVGKMSQPQTKKEVRTFLGMTGYCRRFIQNYASIAEPLTELTKKSQPEKVCWDE